MSYFKESRKGFEAGKVLGKVERSLEEDLELNIEEELGDQTVYVEGSSERPSSEILEDVYTKLEETELSGEVGRYCALIERNGFENVLTLPTEEVLEYGKK